VIFVCAFGIFLPLAHFLTFAPGQGWIAGAPGLGLGATGGWLAILVYSSTVGTSLLLRWRQGAWRRIRLL
jgi:MATE family multidrug resistance protein